MRLKVLVDTTIRFIVFSSGLLELSFTGNLLSGLGFCSGLPVLTLIALKCSSHLESAPSASCYYC